MILLLEWKCFGRQLNKKLPIFFALQIFMELFLPKWIVYPRRIRFRICRDRPVPNDRCR